MCAKQHRQAARLVVFHVGTLMSGVTNRSLGLGRTRRSALQNGTNFRTVFMEGSYDIFERLSDGTLLWVATVEGHAEAISKLKWWGEKRPNEFRLMHIPSNSVIAKVNQSQG